MKTEEQIEKELEKIKGLLATSAYFPHPIAEGMYEVDIVITEEISVKVYLPTRYLKYLGIEE